MTATPTNSHGLAPLFVHNTVALPERYKGNGAQLTAEIQRYYSIFLWDLTTGTIPQDGKLDPSGTRVNAEYFFTVPPKAISMTEPFTTKVIPTQNGGKFIESHGSIFKEIRVQGTTGLRPRKGAPSSIPLLNTSAFETLVTPLGNPAAFTEIRQLPTEEVTGFDDIHFLRNIFRRYSDFKATNRKVVMVWRNVRDGDYWIVEPRDFRLTQDSKNPLTYQYQLNLQGVSKFDAALASVGEVDDPQATLRSVQRFTSRVQEYQQAVTESFLVIATNINRVKGAGYFAIDSIVSPVTGVIKGLSAINNSITAARGVNAAIEEAKANLKTAVETIQDSLEPTTPTQISVDKRDPVVRVFRRLPIILAKIQTEKPLRDSVAATANGRRNTYRNAYVQPAIGRSRVRRGPRTGGDPSYIGNSPSPGSVAEGRVGRGETIRDIAARLLGDARRWHELVVLNDLKAPYTADSATTRPGVLAPGDSVLYPSTDTGGADPFGINPVNTSPDELDAEGQPVVGDVAAQSYGRDIRLKTNVTDGGVELTDISVNQGGDVSTIVGLPNVEQAIRIKFITEVKTLPAHPNFGARYPIGTKADIASFNTFRLNTIATLQSDDRIASVEDLEFTALGDVLALSARVLLNDTRDYLTTSFALRRF